MGTYYIIIEDAGFHMISVRYKREELQRCFTIYLCSVSIATMFGELLANAIAKIDGIQGLAVWRWILVVEGIFALLVDFTHISFVPGSPKDVSWLTEDERNFIIAPTTTIKLNSALVEFCFSSGI